MQIRPKVKLTIPLLVVYFVVTPNLVRCWLKDMLALQFSYDNIVFGAIFCHFLQLTLKKSSPVTGLEWPRGFQEVKVPRFHDNGT